jgi:hypothetical protein
MTDALLENRDYTVIVAKTAARVAHAPPGFENRWVAAETAVLALVHKCQDLDPDGITVYISSTNHPNGTFKQYRQVTSDRLDQVFRENYPPDALNLLDGLHAALEDYFTRKATGQTKPNGEIIVVLIDGEPPDRRAIVKEIVQATYKIDRDQELGIGFVQIGDDLIARGFLDALDENLRSAVGAKFDIVNTKVLEEIKTDCLTDFLLDIIRD